MLINGFNTAVRFSEAFRSAFGSGITDYGGRFAVASRGTMEINVSSGFAFVGGHWIFSDSTESLYITASNYTQARYDAVVLRANESTRTVYPAVREGVPAGVPQKPEPVRDGVYYEIVLAYVYVGAGASRVVSDNITDTRSNASLCGLISTLSEATPRVRELTAMLQTDAEDRLQTLAERLQVNASAAAEAKEQSVKTLQTELDTAKNEVHGATTSAIELLETKKDEEISALIAKQIEAAKTLTLLPAEVFSALSGAIPVVGKLLTTAEESPDGYLLCDGSTIPEQHTDLIALIGDSLPDIPSSFGISTWIYAGTGRKEYYFMVSYNQNYAGTEMGEDGKTRNLYRVETYGLSTDAKPTDTETEGIASGSSFVEMDTSKIFFYSRETSEWYEFRR